MSEVFQSGIPRRPPEPRGALLRPSTGMVTATYYADDPTLPASRARQVLCDVILAAGGFCSKIPVAQEGYSVTNGSLWVPQPAKGTISGEPLRLLPTETAPGTALEDMDGDFVLVLFQGGTPQTGVVLKAMPHPGSKRPQNGTQPLPLPTYTPGEAEALPATPDGNERWIGHQGATARLDRAGNARLDLSGAGVGNDGQTNEAGDATSGWLDINVRAGARVIIRSQGVPVFVLTSEADGQITLDIGKDAAERAILGERFMHLYDGHKHRYLLGETTAVIVEDRMATAQLDPTLATLSERVRLPAGEGAAP